MSTRTIILRLVAGAYVFYLGMQLLKGYMSGAETGNPIVSLIGGIVFLAAGAFFVFTGIRGVAKNFKEFQEVPEDANADGEVEVEAEAEEVEESEVEAEVVEEVVADAEEVVETEEA